MQFGPNVNPTRTNPFVELFDAGAFLPMSEFDQDLFRQNNNMRWDSAPADIFENIVFPFGFERLEAKRARGTVVANLTSVPTGTDPMLTPGDVTFIDARGERYDLEEDVPYPEAGATTVELKVVARILGVLGNVEAGSITGEGTEGGIELSNDAEGIFEDHVGSFTNPDVIGGGRDTENGAQMKQRFRVSRASRPGSSPAGVEQSVSVVAGVTGVRIVENRTMQGSARENTSEHTGDSDASETIGATNTRIAQKVAISDRRFTQRVQFKLAANTDLAGTFRLETDNAGDPSGTLVDPAFTKAHTFTSTDAETLLFTFGEYLEPGTYHLVFQRDSGSGTFAGSDDSEGNVKVFDGSWSGSSNVGNIFHTVIGGIPPRSFRLFISGTGYDDDAVALAIGDRSAGIPSDGLEDGDWENRAGQLVKEHWDQPIQVPLVIKATMDLADSFDQSSAFLKDLLIDHIGGTKSGGNVVSGVIGVGDEVIRNKLISRLLNKDLVGGTEDVTEFLIERKSNRATPQDLEPGDTNNIVMGIDEEAVISSLDDIFIIPLDEEES